MATDIPKWWQQPSASASPTQTWTQMARQMNRWAIIPISIDKLKASHLDTSACQNIDFSSKRFVLNSKTQAHGQLDGWMNAWNDNNSHWYWCSMGNKSSGYISMPNVDLFLQMICKCNTQTQSHGWSDKWMNAWNDNNTHQHQRRPRVNHLDTSTCQFLCYPFKVICQQMCKNLKKWWMNGRTDGQMEGQTSGWRVFLCHPHLDAG